jgi:hypothetical protein
MVRVKDAAAHCRTARENGTRILMEPTDFDYGERQYSAEDPAGHQWTFSENLDRLCPRVLGPGVRGLGLTCLTAETAARP